MRNVAIYQHTTFANVNRDSKAMDTQSAEMWTNVFSQTFVPKEPYVQMWKETSLVPAPQDTLEIRTSKFTTSTNA
jgi:hypothetical protein